MSATAAVINAGLGDISLGLEMAGFKVVAAYESDEKSAAVHEMNINAPVYRLLPEGIDAEGFPEIDLLAARMYCPSFSLPIHKEHSYCASLYKLCEILSRRKPRALFMLLNSSSVKGELLQVCLDEIDKAGYQCTWQKINVADTTGLPIKENMVFLVGTPHNTEKAFQFPAYTSTAQMLAEHYLQLDQLVDSWYFNVRHNSILQHEDEKRFYCWKNRAYAGTDLVQWNYQMVPLVNTREGIRKITHREIANLKCFPTHYSLPDSKTRQWLYQKLMYAGNVLLIKQVAGRLDYILTDNPWRNQNVARGMRFENLVGRYLENLADNGLVEREHQTKDLSVDFMLRLGDKTLYFGLKCYNGRSAPASKVRIACKQLSALRSEGLPILVIANEITDHMKAQCLEEFGVSIWDVRNLLYLFDKFADIKNEFIASLDYAIEHIAPEQPMPDVFQNIAEGKKTELSWEEKLLRILPGREHFQEYETACTEILKYVLGDYLALWEAQESSNDGLYRFDLCCKIKNGANHDFFDTIKHYFNTKYIVFEFKNYIEKISQKEIYTTEKYLYEKALRKVAVIISRLGADAHALKAARGSLRETGKLILCLSDNDLLEMIDIKMRGEQEPAEFLGVLLDGLLVHLEK